MNDEFIKLPLKAPLQNSLQILKYERMTPIQAKSLPLILEGKDILAQAKTGSGKTAAFGLGVLNYLDLKSDKVQALILCPTRELAEQVTVEIRRLARALSNVKVLKVCGGSSESLQEQSLNSGAHIVVGTPGRILRLLNREVLDLQYLNQFVLDEADRMLDMGFEEDLKNIISYLPLKRQSLFFSATYPEDIKSLSAKFQKQALEVKVDILHEDENIEQKFYELRPTQDKNNLLYKILAYFKIEQAIVFCRTKKETVEVAAFLASRNIVTNYINGDLEQRERTSVLAKFLNKSSSVLVATDVAARGLDIKALPAVINYNMPGRAEDYIHRVGRTGRASRTGKAFSFVSSLEKFRLDEIYGLTGKECIIEDPAAIPYGVKYNFKPLMKTIYISGGKKDKLRPGDIVGAIVGEAKINASEIGDISVLDLFSYVAIKANCVEHVIKKLSTGKIKKKKFKVGLA